MRRKMHKNSNLDHNYRIMTFMGELVAGADHEINNLIMMIQGSSEILNDESTTSQQKAMALDAITTKTKRIKNIMSDLRAVLKDGSQDQVKTFNIKDLMDKSISLCKTRFKNHKIFIAPQVSEDLQVDGKETQLIQALLAVLTSSHDAIMHHQERWMKIEVNETETSLVLRIKDSGEELTREEQIFLLKSDYISPDGRTGVGLSLAKDIIEEHKGTMTLGNENGNPVVTMSIPKRIHNASLQSARKVNVIMDEIEIFNENVVVLNSKKAA